MNLRSFGVAFIAVSLSIWPTYGVVFSGTGLQWCLTGALTLTSNRRTTERPSKELLRNRLGQFSRIVIFLWIYFTAYKKWQFHLHILMSKGLQDFVELGPLSIDNLWEPKKKIEIFSIMTLNNKEYILINQCTCIQRYMRCRTFYHQSHRLGCISPDIYKGIYRLEPLEHR